MARALQADYPINWLGCLNYLLIGIKIIKIDGRLENLNP